MESANFFAAAAPATTAAVVTANAMASGPAATERAAIAPAALPAPAAGPAPAAAAPAAGPATLPTIGGATAPPLAATVFSNHPTLGTGPATARLTGGASTAPLAACRSNVPTLGIDGAAGPSVATVPDAGDLNSPIRAPPTSDPRTPLRARDESLTASKSFLNSRRSSIADPIRPPTPRTLASFWAEDSRSAPLVRDVSRFCGPLTLSPGPGVRSAGCALPGVRIGAGAPPARSVQMISSCALTKQPLGLRPEHTLAAGIHAKPQRDFSQVRRE